MSRAASEPKDNESGIDKSSASKKYLEYLEEMELKIRYMKNDIEFKTLQLKNKVMNTKQLLPSSYHTHSERKVLLPQSSSQPPKQVKGVPIVHNHSTASSSNPLVKSKDTRFVVPVKQTGPSQQYSSTVPQPSSSVFQKAKINVSMASSVKLSEEKVFNVPTVKPVLYVSPNKRTVVYSKASTNQNEVSSVKTNLMHSTNSYSVASSTAVAPKPVVSSTVYFPRGSTTVNSSKFQSDRSVQLHSSKGEFHKHPLPNQLTGSAENKNQPLSQPVPLICESTSKTYANKPQHLKVKTSSKLVSKYKLQRLSPSSTTKKAPQFCSSKQHWQSPLKVVKPRKSQPITNSSAHQSVMSKAVNRYKWKNVNSTSAECQASGSIIQGSNSLPLSSLKLHGKVDTVTPKKTLSERRFMMNFRTPHKLQIASKLVTKYKLKRLSPTSTKSSPQLCHPASLLTDPNSKHKIDKRNIGGAGVVPVVTSTQNPHKFKSRHKLDYRKMIRHDNQASSVHKFSNSSSPALSSSFSNVVNTHKWVNSNLYAGMIGLRGLNKVHQRKPLTPNRLKLRRRSSSTRNTLKSAQALSSRFKWSRAQLQHNTLKRYKFRHVMSQSNNPGSSCQKGKIPLRSSLRHRQENFKFVTIGGQLYSASSRKLTHAGKHKVFKKSPFRLDLRKQNMEKSSSHGSEFDDKVFKKLPRKQSAGDRLKHLSHLDRRHMSLVRIRPDTFERLTIDGTRLAASQAVHRSRAIAAAKFRKDNRRSKAKRRHCMFFGRFGKCHRGERCPFIHDPEKVAMCTRFLRGKCEKPGCPFSHKASVHKMPVCLFYLRGSCFRPDCPYLHVNVNPEAPVCTDFLNGFCSLGDKCKKMHSFVCPTFAAVGKCAKGNQCSMLHRQTTRKTVQIPKRDQGEKKSESAAEAKTTTTKKLLRKSLSDSNLHALDSSLHNSSHDFITTSGNPCLSLLKPGTVKLQAQPSFISLAPSISTPQDKDRDNMDKIEKNKDTSTVPLQSKPRITPAFLTWKKSNLS